MPWPADKFDVRLEIIRRGHNKSYEVLSQRLVRDWEQLTAVATILVTIAASAALLLGWA
jgi:hypothetical protein